MSKVFVSMGVSLDGYVAGPNRSLQNMGGDGWGSLHAWVFGQRELVLSLAPTLFGGGVRLFEGIDKNAVDVSILEVVSSPRVTHLRYALTKKR